MAMGDGNMQMWWFSVGEEKAGLYPNNSPTHFEKNVHTFD